MNSDIQQIIAARRHPGSAFQALISRELPATPVPEHKFLVIAADHPARGAFAAGPDSFAMADRWDLLGRIRSALAIPGVDGYLGCADTIEDLALLGALDKKWVFGSMNRGAVLGADWELDDRQSGYDVEGIVEANLAGGKMLLRIDSHDRGSLETLEWSGKVVSGLARAQKIAMVEPFMSNRRDGRVVNDLTTDAVVTSAAIASGLGSTSSYTWLKVPDTHDIERLARSTTLPLVILGGEVKDDEEATFARWEALLELPNVIGLVIGRSLLYPPSGDVEAAVSRAAQLVCAH
ncbi:aldolase [Arcanobacterium haemolyticum]|nr:aldolase [Arcanobacterium haemolyticum]